MVQPSEPNGSTYMHMGDPSERVAALTLEDSALQNGRASARPPVAGQALPPVSQHCFSAEAMDTAVHFQIVDLGKQLYIWVASGSLKLGNISLAMPMPVGPGNVPPATTLIRGPGEGEGGALARRLALKTGRPVAVAWNVPESSPLLCAYAERRLLEELASLGMSSAPPP
eukprot:jgi/Botrbrau1/20470/Bobra.145_2s0031.1